MHNPSYPISYNFPPPDAPHLPPSKAMATLTGFPCERLELREARGKGGGEGGGGGDLLWAQLLSSHTAGFLLSASVSGADSSEAAAAEAMGLLSDHAYSLLRVVGVRGERLVQLRNPWGKLEWKGEWSDHSRRWSEEMRREVGEVAASDDGKFWMGFTDFIDFFSCVDVCRVRPDWAEVCNRLTLTVPITLILALSLLCVRCACAARGASPLRSLWAPSD